MKNKFIKTELYIKIQTDADSILSSASDLTDGESNLDSLANQIAFLLNNPELPTPLYNAMMHGIGEIGNSKTMKFWKSLKLRPNISKPFF